MRTGQNSTKNGIRERPSFGGLFFLPFTKRTPAGRYLQTSGKAVYVVSIAALTPSQTYSACPSRQLLWKGSFCLLCPLFRMGVLLGRNRTNHRECCRIARIDLLQKEENSPHHGLFCETFLNLSHSYDSLTQTR